MNTRLLQSLVLLTILCSSLLAQAPANMSWLTSTRSFIASASLDLESVSGDLTGGDGVITDHRSSFRETIPVDAIGQDFLSLKRLVANHRYYVRVTSPDSQITHTMSLRDYRGWVLFSASSQFTLEESPFGWQIPSWALRLSPVLVSYPQVRVADNIRAIEVLFTAPDGTVSRENVNVDWEDDEGNFATVPAELLGRIDEFEGNVQFAVGYYDDHGWNVAVYDRSGRPDGSLIEATGAPAFSLTGMSFQELAAQLLDEGDYVPVVHLRVPEPYPQIFRGEIYGRDPEGNPIIVEKAYAFKYFQWREGTDNASRMREEEEWTEVQLPDAVQTYTMPRGTYLILYRYPSGRETWGFRG